ncbi:transposase [Methylococcaceae bacterium HT4]|nr:transposase [Methylococcaceae bacterium HT4]
MARLPRITPADVPVHLVQRGNNRQACYGSEEEQCAYAEWLKIYSKKYEIDIHAWVFMTNHVHLLCTPQQEGAIGRMMQSLGRSYVRYFNYQYQRTGTLWEGRYKSCLVQAEQYLLEVYRYIELNPVRASMVTEPAEYSWSSYQINALGKSSDLCTPHPEYLSLGKTEYDRLKSYRALFSHHVDDILLEEIRSNTNKGMAIGSDYFKQQMTTLTGRRLVPEKGGRPIGWRKAKNGS